MKKQILLYNIKDKKRAIDIRRVLMPLKIRIKQVAAADFGQPIGYLADIDGFDACEDLSGDFSFDDEMMIMVGLTSFEIDQVIKGFHKKRIACLLYTSKYLPTILLTCIFSVSPLTPGIRQQIPLTIMSILTPAFEASINFSMIFLSLKEFIFNPIYAGSPIFACSISRSIMWITLFCRQCGATNK